MRYFMMDLEEQSVLSLTKEFAAISFYVLKVFNILNIFIKIHRKLGRKFLKLVQLLNDLYIT